MKIISKFKDYYDYMVYLGMDDKCVYLRNEHEIDEDTKNTWPTKKKTVIQKYTSYREWFNFNTGDRSDESKPSLHHRWVAFCGKQYHCWIHVLPQIKKWNGQTDIISQDRSYEIIWDAQRAYELCLAGS